MVQVLLKINISKTNNKLSLRLIPYSRGLDSFKWAIRNKLIVGNTLHFIDSNIDYGRIIYQKKTPLYTNDSLLSFSERHYQEEISIISNFIKYINININYKKKKNCKFK